jgi:hypothetical protein
MDYQAILAQALGELDEAVRALEAVGVAFAYPLYLSAQLFAAMVAHP